MVPKYLVYSSKYKMLKEQLNTIFRRKNITMITQGQKSIEIKTKLYKHAHN